MSKTKMGIINRAIYSKTVDVQRRIRLKCTENQQWARANSICYTGKHGRVLLQKSVVERNTGLTADHMFSTAFRKTTLDSNRFVIAKNRVKIGDIRADENSKKAHVRIAWQAPQQSELEVASFAKIVIASDRLANRNSSGAVVEIKSIKIHSPFPMVLLRRETRHLILLFLIWLVTMRENMYDAHARCGMTTAVNDGLQSPQGQTSIEKPGVPSLTERSPLPSPRTPPFTMVKAITERIIVAPLHCKEKDFKLPSRAEFATGTMEDKLERMDGLILGLGRFLRGKSNIHKEVFSYQASLGMALSALVKSLES
ncbi:unnamed protein product [Trichogramma brassicae]|uniref:Uncharacterized protein n=1 Tax=Trichogramma brassicae TaxID=86971 RepID=A0A6H5I730_9HYME|nr:unnamed protein product [Trichogramma brassicae]